MVLSFWEDESENREKKASTRLALDGETGD
jgi:hypothetical protein